MKKEAIVLYLLFLVLLASFVFALGAGGSAASNAVNMSDSENVLLTADVPLDSGSAAGYWIAYVEELGTEPGNEKIVPYYWYASDPDTDHTLFTERADPSGRFKGDAVGFGPLYYNELYDTFNIPHQGSSYGGEILGLKFVLDMSLWKDATILGDGNTLTDDAVLPSHVSDSPGTLNTKSQYEGSTPDADSNTVSDCLSCPDADDLPACMASSDLQWTCVYVPILKRSNCTYLADQAAPFCEGISGLGANEGKIAIEAAGIPGFGGCRNASFITGRDWYNDTSGSNPDAPGGFSNANLFSTENVGFCCGNDPEDVGVLRPNLGEIHSNSLDGVMCMPVPSHDPGTAIPFSSDYLPKDSNSVFAYIWNSADSDAFSIRKLNRSGLLFDAVSNTKNWFFCNASTSSDSLDKYYLAYSPDRSKWLGSGNSKTPGPVLPEFAVLPSPPEENRIGYGVTSGVGAEGGAGDGEGVIGSGTNEQAENTATGNSRSEVIDENSFDDGFTVSGPLASTPCDKDGDGFDAPYSRDSIDEGQNVNGAFAGFVDKYNPDCRDPQPPFDCDDSDPSHHPGSALDCSEIGSDFTDWNCNGVDDRQEYCISFENEACSPEHFDPDLCQLSPRDLSERFICFNEELDSHTTLGSFAECCGPSLSFCKNPIGPGRREGSFIKTLREFNTYDAANTGDPESAVCGRNDTNCVLRYSIAKPTQEDVDNNRTFSIGFRNINNDLKINDWSDYDYLEFYIYFTANFAQNIRIGKLVSDDPGLIDSYMYYFDAPIVDYVVDEPKLGKWLHVMIPISEFKSVPDQVDLILLYARADELSKTGSTVTIAGVSGEFVNVVGLDKIHLSKRADDGSKVDRVCTGAFDEQQNTDFRWLSDLDEIGPESADNPREKWEQLGRTACNAVPSFGWTGTSCCGDDTGKNTYFGVDNNKIKRIVGDDTFKEFYNDTEGGCWAGNPIADGQRMMVLQYNLTFESSDLIGVDKLFNRSCTSRMDCSFNLPHIPGLVIENDHPDMYDLIVVSPGVRDKVGHGTMLDDNDYLAALLKAENVPLQILYFNKSFHSCNAAPYLFDLKNTNTGDPLISEDENYGSCAVVGDYFCDNKDGANIGWSSASLKTYPLSTNITLRDGTVIDLVSNPDAPPEARQPTHIVLPRYRTEPKYSYNLIKNGGFENFD